MLLTHYCLLKVSLFVPGELPYTDANESNGFARTQQSTDNVHGIKELCITDNIHKLVRWTNKNSMN